MKKLTTLAVMFTLVAVLTPIGTALADHMSGPFTVGNLQVYMLRPDVGVTRQNGHYASLEAALRNETLRIVETGSIEQADRGEYR